MKHFKGDAVEYTGHSKELHGAIAYEYMFVEGHREGQTIWQYTKPEVIVAEGREFHRVLIDGVLRYAQA